MVAVTNAREERLVVIANDLIDDAILRTTRPGLITGESATAQTGAADAATRGQAMYAESSGGRT